MPLTVSPSRCIPRLTLLFKKWLTRCTDVITLLRTQVKLQDLWAHGKIQDAPLVDALKSKVEYMTAVTHKDPSARLAALRAQLDYANAVAGRHQNNMRERDR